MARARPPKPGRGADVDRTQRTLAIVLAAQVAVLAVFQFAFPASHAAVKEQPLFPTLASMTPQKVEIEDGTGNSVALDRESGAWSLEKPKGYPVTTSKVEKLIEDVGKLNAGRPVVTNARNHAALKVADGEFERHIRIWEKASGKPSAELYLGTSPRFQSTHVRVGGKDAVYEASGLNSYDVQADAGSWVERTLINVPADSLAEIGVSNAKGSFQLVKKNGAWSVKAPAARAKAALDAQKVDALVRTLCGLSLESPAGPESDAAYGLASPTATLVFQRMPAAGDSAAAAAAGPLVVRIGAEVPGKEGEHYAARSGFGFAVTVPKYSVDRALEASLGDLLPAPPVKTTPTTTTKTPATKK
jgi:hypothetical protein